LPLADLAVGVDAEVHAAIGLEELFKRCVLVGRRACQLVRQDATLAQVVVFSVEVAVGIGQRVVLAGYALKPVLGHAVVILLNRLSTKDFLRALLIWRLVALNETLLVSNARNQAKLSFVVK